LASLNARAAAYAGMGNFEDARRDLEAALKEEAGNEIVTANMAMMTPT
jgi:Flp pilus assembly protein TadD